MHIFLIRHGEAVSPAAWAGGENARPLSDKGRKDIANVAKGLAKNNINIDKIISSPLARAKQTAEIIGAELKIEPQLIKEISSGAKPEDIRKVLANYKDESIMVVGHIPDLVLFLGRLVQDPRHLEDSLSPGEIIALQTDSLEKGWMEGKLLWRRKAQNWK